jgi:hypothetical protein
VKAVAYLRVRASLDSDPTRNDLLQRQELREVVWQAKEKIIAPHYLKPLEPLIAHLEHGRDIARYVLVVRFARFAWEIHFRIPDLEYDLATVRISRQNIGSAPQLIKAEVTA